jgi:hypothetical protein
MGRAEGPFQRQLPVTDTDQISFWKYIAREGAKNPYFSLRLRVFRMRSLLRQSSFNYAVFANFLFARNPH